MVYESCQQCSSNIICLWFELWILPFKMQQLIVFLSWRWKFNSTEEQNAKQVKSQQCMKVINRVIIMLDTYGADRSKFSVLWKPSTVLWVNGTDFEFKIFNMQQLSVNFLAWRWKFDSTEVATIPKAQIMPNKSNFSGLQKLSIVF